MIERLCLVKKFQLVTFLYTLPFSLYSIGKSVLPLIIDTISLINSCTIKKYQTKKLVYKHGLSFIISLVHDMYPPPKAGQYPGEAVYLLQRDLLLRVVWWG